MNSDILNPDFCVIGAGSGGGTVKLTNKDHKKIEYNSSINYPEYIG